MASRDAESVADGGQNQLLTMEHRALLRTSRSYGRQYHGL